jgi:heptaprenyl diphosphate synthase
LITNIANEIISAGGKRLRPAFVIISSKFGNPDNEKIKTIAGAIEILHTATLIHDDIVDKAKTRRGIETVFAKYGVEMALYMGDYLFTKAVLILSKNIPIENLTYIASGVKTICEGEIDQFNQKFNINISILSYLKRISRKTAGLFSAASGLGAGVSNCQKETIRALTGFGFNYGMAFQIKDDLENLNFSFENNLKPTGNDVIDGIITIPVIYAIKENHEITSELNNFYKSKSDFQKIIKLVKETKCIEQSRILMDKYLSRAENSIKILKNTSYKEILINILKTI